MPIQRLEQLTSQLQWRLTEHGECYYMVGVADDGTILGLHKNDLDDSLTMLGKMCNGVGAQIASIEERRVSRRPELYAAEVRISLISPPADICTKRTVKVAFVGDSDSGKSTLIGVLSGGILDDGEGSVRLSLLRHRHEVISGRTSSVAVEFLPFDNETKQPIRHDFESLELLSIAKQKQLLNSNRVAQLFDLAGDVRYQKTTYSALTSWATPDWICVVFPVTSNVDALKDLLTLVLGLEIPFFVVLSKIDLVDQSVVMNYATEIPALVKDLRKELFDIDSSQYFVSVLRVSCVGGEGIDNLTQHFYRLRPRRNVRLMNYLMDTFTGVEGLFCVEGIQSVPEVGTVLLGTVIHGSITVGKPMSCYIGPNSKGDFIPISITSAHRMRLLTQTILPDQLATLAIEPESLISEINRGSILAVYSAEPSTLVKLEMTNLIEANVIGCTPEQAEAVTEPVHGMLYWMGSRWSAQLMSLKRFYGEMKQLATFRLNDAVAAPLPSSRVIFVGPHFRIEGIVHLSLNTQ